MTEESANHLTDAARSALALPIEERIKYVRKDRWIGYPEAEEALNKLESLYTYPKIDRMPCMLLVSDTNNGKTTIVNRFQREWHPPHDNPDGDAIIYPVMVVQAPPVPDEGRFLDGILEILSAPYKSRDKPAKKMFEVIKLFRQIQLVLLIIDEIHNILAGSTRNQHNFRNVIRYLSNELKIPIAGAGTREALNAITTDPQLTNRFKPFFLPRWTIGDGKHPEKDPYLRFLVSYESTLPLRNPSNLANPKNPAVALKLLSMSEGLLGELVDLIKQAAVEAIKSGKERIDLELLEKIDWIPPKGRKSINDKKKPAAVVGSA
jgi:hypothetical protein